ncbi:S1/P1 nuclease [Aquimarina sp. ERC-38]|uniref:S1/P1 nuclease n=1 Tax=Aquimarina sp. ERC-38 TaxID=2949996 RepID=UPI002245C838|nr:S1/P1 nuclease [Aquimarina sp. ERC-38]UZO79415.1 S1/P1 nuclease [Aquimarina sp. ERC-38]
MRNKFLFFGCLLFAFQFVLGSPKWGKTGHRATGQIATTYLSPKAKKEIAKILDRHTLAFVSIYADEIKSDHAYDKYSPWHYVNFPFGKKYGDETPSEKGDLIKGIQKAIKILKDDKASNEDKSFYLKLLVHFIGDLHQPLHVGRSEDKGGNMVQVRWFDEGSNLHRVWDSDMLNYYGMSYTELSENCDELSLDQINAIEKGTVLDWVYESQDLAKQVYESAKSGEELGYAYVYHYFPLVRKQLQKGGIRLAKILNEIYG